MFKVHRCYTHRNMLDAAILVRKSYRLPDGRYKLKVRWVRKDGFDFGIEERVTIASNQIGNWYEIIV